MENDPPLYSQQHPGEPRVEPSQNAESYNEAVSW